MGETTGQMPHQGPGRGFLIAAGLVLAGLAGAYVLAPQIADRLREPEEAREETPRLGRPYTILWHSDNRGMPIDIRISETLQRGRIGETMMVEYTFSNRTDRRLYFKPVHSVVPLSAALPEVMNLIKCFCFDHQVIEPRQTYTLPIVYQFTDQLDGKTSQITMNYQLFESTEEMYEAFMDRERRKTGVAVAAPELTAGEGQSP